MARKKTTYRRNKWTTDKSNHRPVESHNAHAQACYRSKQGVHSEVVWGNPTDPIEHAQCCEKVSGNPVPDKTAGQCNDKKAFAANVSVGLAIVFVKGVEQSCVDQSPRPNHARGPNNELSQKAAEGISNSLTADCQEDLVAERDHLTIEDTLGQYDLSGVGADSSDIGHDCNADVFLDVKGAWVERPDIAKSFEAFRWEYLSETTTQGKTKE